MKKLYVLATLLFSAQLYAAVCGQVKDISSDHDGVIVGFTVANESQDYRITDSNSPELVDSLGWGEAYFVCLDKFETYERKLKNKNEIRLYASTSEWRLWKDHKLVASLPQTSYEAHKEIKAVAYELGEYVDELDTTENYKVVLVKSSDISKDLQETTVSLLKIRNKELADGDYDAGIFDSKVLAIQHKVTKEVIGYILKTEEYVDHPYHSGSGVNYYINKSFKALFKIDWAG